MMRTTLNAKTMRKLGISRDEMGVDLTLGSKSDWITIRKTKQDYKDGKRLVNGQSNCFHDFLMVSVFTPVYKWHMDYNPDKYFIHRTVGYSCPYKGHHQIDEDMMKTWLMQNYTKDELKDGARLFVKYQDHAITFANYKECPIFKISPRPNTYIKKYEDSRGMRISYEQNAQKLNPLFVDWFDSIANDYDTNKTSEDAALTQDFVDAVFEGIVTEVKKKERMSSTNTINTFADMDEYFTYIVKEILLNNFNVKRFPNQTIELHRQQLSLEDGDLYVSSKTDSEYKIKEQFYTLVKKKAQDILKANSNYATIRASMSEEIAHLCVGSKLTDGKIDMLYVRYLDCIALERMSTQLLIMYLKSKNSLFPVKSILQQKEE